MQSSTVLAEPAPSLRLVAAPHPFSTERIDLALPAGPTLAELIGSVQCDPVLLRHAHVFLGDQPVPRALWPRARPKPGTLVTLRVVPAGGGGGSGKNPLRTVLSIAVIAAAFAFGGPLGEALVGAEAFTLFGTEIAASALGSAIIGIAGTLLVSAIAPPARPKLGDLSRSASRDSPTLFITGARNEANPFGIVPRPLGRHRMVPPYGAQPFTEIVGDDQYLRLLFVWGYGPLEIADLRIGETPIAAFEGVEVETRAGYADDPPLTLYTDDVFEDSLQVALAQASGWQTRTTQPDADEISVDVTFPQGLVTFDAEGNRQSRTVSVEVEYSPAGAGAWVAAGTVTVTGNRSSAIRRGLRWTVGRGQYDVRLRRTTPDTDSTQIFDATLWTALRSIADRDPVLMPGLAKTALRIRATDQLSGVVDRFNGIVQSVLPDWDAASQSWAERATSNPASLYREVLQGKANARPLADSRLDVAGLQEWHEACAAAGRSFDMAIDFAGSVQEVLADVAAAGRAAPAIRDGKWGVVVDQPQSVPVQHFTPRNSWGFSGRKTFAELPHGWRVRFVNRETDWQQDERIVYDDGYDAGNATRFERLELPGITDPDQVWRDGRYHIATARLRPETYSFFADLEHIVCTRGDLVRVTHDVPLWGLASGRVKQVLDDGANATAVVLDEEVSMEAGRSYSVRFRNSDGGSLVQAVATEPGDTNTLTFASPVPLASAPSVQDLAMFGESGSESAELIVRAIEPGPDLSARLVCVDAAPAVHLADQGPIPAFQSGITLPAGLTAPVIVDIRSDESVLVRAVDGALQARIVIALGALASRNLDSIVAIETRIRPAGGDGAWSAVPDAPADATGISIEGVEQGAAYEIRLRYRRRDGTPGPWTATATHTVIGKLSPPPDVPSLLLQGDRLVWSYPDAPRDHAGFLVRHQAGVNRAWASAIPAHPGVWADSPFSIADVPGGTRTLMVKAIDVAGNESVNAAVLVRDLGDPVLANLVVSRDYPAEGFPGTVANGAVLDGALKADDTGQLFWSGDDANAFWPGNPNSLFWQDTYLAMSWIAGFVPEADAVGRDSRLTLAADVAGESWSLAYRTGGPSLFWHDDAAPLWSDDAGAFWEAPDAFAPWPGAIDGVARQRYELRTVTAAGRKRGVVSGFTVSVDVPDLEEAFEDVALPADGARLPITRTYRRIKTVNLTLQDDGGSAETAKVMDKDPDLGPLVRAFDGAGAGAPALIDARIQGY